MSQLSITLSTEETLPVEGSISECYASLQQHLKNSSKREVNKCWCCFCSTIGHVNEYHTMHYFGNPRHTQSMIAYMILTERFWKFQWKIGFWKCCLHALLRRIGGFSGKADIYGAKDVETIILKYDYKIMASLFHFNAYPGKRLDFSRHCMFL